MSHRVSIPRPPPPAPASTRGSADTARLDDRGCIDQVLFQWAVRVPVRGVFGCSLLTNCIFFCIKLIPVRFEGNKYSTVVYTCARCETAEQVRTQASPHCVVGQ